VRLVYFILYAPILIFFSIYFLQQLDKSTLAYASVFNLASDTGLVGYQYSALGSIVYAG
jgi:hypothetical protein